jgi:hypothetical protein
MEVTKWLKPSDIQTAVQNTYYLQRHLLSRKSFERLCTQEFKV